MLLDQEGREFLRRSGSGTITAIGPCGSPRSDGEHVFVRITILVDGAVGPSNSIRFQATALTATGSSLHQIALEAFDDQQGIAWTIEWHRHDWVPGELPITALNLASDTRGIVVELQPAAVDEAPMMVPVEWAEAQQ